MQGVRPAYPSSLQRVNSRTGTGKAGAHGGGNLGQGRERPAACAPRPIDDVPRSLRPVGEAFREVLTAAGTKAGPEVDPRTVAGRGSEAEFVDPRSLGRVGVEHFDQRFPVRIRGERDGRGADETR